MARSDGFKRFIPVDKLEYYCKGSKALEQIYKKMIKIDNVLIDSDILLKLIRFKVALRKTQFCIVESPFTNSKGLIETAYEVSNFKYKCIFMNNRKINCR